MKRADITFGETYLVKDYSGLDLMRAVADGSRKNRIVCQLIRTSSTWRRLDVSERPTVAFLRPMTEAEWEERQEDAREDRLRAVVDGLSDDDAHRVAELIKERFA